LIVCHHEKTVVKTKHFKVTELEYLNIIWTLMYRTVITGTDCWL
jgi:hypothetical protein